MIEFLCKFSIGIIELFYFNGGFIFFILFVLSVLYLTILFCTTVFDKTFLFLYEAKIQKDGLFKCTKGEARIQSPSTHIPLFFRVLLSTVEVNLLAI